MFAGKFILCQSLVYFKKKKGLEHKMLYKEMYFFGHFFFKLTILFYILFIHPLSVPTPWTGL